MNQFTEHTGGLGGGITYCGYFQNCIHGAWRNGNHVVLKKDFEVDLLRVKKTANIVHTKGARGGVYFSSPSLYNALFTFRWILWLIGTHHRQGWDQGRSHSDAEMDRIREWNSPTSLALGSGSDKRGFGYAYGKPRREVCVLKEPLFQERMGQVGSFIDE